MKKHKFNDIIKEDPWVLNLLRYHCTSFFNPDEPIQPATLDDFVKNRLEHLAFRPFDSIRAKLEEISGSVVHHEPQLSPLKLWWRKRFGAYIFCASEWSDAMESTVWFVHCHILGEAPLSLRGAARGSSLKSLIDHFKRTAGAQKKKLIVDAISSHHVPGKGNHRVRINVYRVDRPVMEL